MHKVFPPGVAGFADSHRLRAATSVRRVAEYFDPWDPELTEQIAAVLAEIGPMSEDQLLSVLEERGVALGDDAELALADALDDADGQLMMLADDRWVSLPALLDSRMFTHQLTGPEVDYDILNPMPDLDPVAMLLANEQYQRLADGSSVVEALLPLDMDLLTERGIPLRVVGDHGAILLPAGYLREKGLSEGDLLAVRVTGDGLVLEGAPDTGAQPEQVAAVRDRLTSVLAANPDEPVSIDEAVWTACADDSTLFTGNLPPLGEVLDSRDLVRHGDLLTLAEFDIERWRLDVRRTDIAERYDLDDDEALAVLALTTVYAQVADLYQAAVSADRDGALEELVAGAQVPQRLGQADDLGSTVRAILPALAESVVAAAVLDEITNLDGESAAALGLFAETLESQAPREARPALRWLRGKAHERLGDVIQAEAQYQAAESLDPSWPLSLVDLARSASDRGDAAQALSLLRRAGAPPNDALVRLLERFEEPAQSDLGRNEPCWCGSGRKYKKCHLNNEQHPLEERAAWLYQKAVIFLGDGDWAGTTLAVAESRAKYSDNAYRLLDALADPLVNDAVLFEGGAFAEFVAARGGLLPADERLLADQWLLIERSLYEVQEVRRDEGCTVRDVRTGDIHRVRERTATRQLEVSDLVCTRVVPAGDTMQFFGGLEPVALHDRDQLIAMLDSEPDPVELVSLLTRRFAPPSLQNTEGDPLVLCEATLRTGDAKALAAALDKTYESANGGEWFDVSDGEGPIRATLRLGDDELTVHANSEARFDRVLETVRSLDETLTIVQESRQPARDPREAAARVAERSSGAASADPADPTDPSLAAVLDQFVRDYERKWLDEPIPALAGHSPREAAADPTRRGDLIRLLDSFPSDEGRPGVMSPDRLRSALDLR